MKLGKVIGTVTATQKDPGLTGLRILVVCDLNDDYQPIGKPYVAADAGISPAEGDIVYLVSAREAALSISRTILPTPDDLVPVDAAIVGYVDQYNVNKTTLTQDQAEKPQKAEKKRMPPPTLKIEEDITDKKEEKLKQVRETRPPRSSSRQTKARIPSESQGSKEKPPNNLDEIKEKIPTDTSDIKVKTPTDPNEIRVKTPRKIDEDEDEVLESDNEPEDEI